VREPIPLVVALFQRDEDAHIVLAGLHLDRGARKLGGDLVEAAGSEAPFGAGNMEGRYWRVVRCLLRQVGDSDEVLRARFGAVLRDGEGDGRGIGIFCRLDGRGG